MDRQIDGQRDGHGERGGDRAATHNSWTRVVESQQHCDGKEVAKYKEIVCHDG